MKSLDNFIFKKTDSKHQPTTKTLKYHYVKKSPNDCFYTDEQMARQLTQFVFKKYGRFYKYIEPSAGAGAFTKPLKKIGASFKAYDIKPKGINIEKKDFLKLKLSSSNFIMIGNPPFGKNSSLALKFFNKCAINSKAICFVLPKTFRKISIQNRLDLNFNLVYDRELPKNSFIFNKQVFDVPSCFQIWEKQKNKRPILKIENNKFIEFVKPKEAEFCVRRVGGRAGHVLEGLNHSLSSTYFLKEKIKGIKQIVRQVDFFDVVNNTAGVRSLSKTELIFGVKQKWESLQ